MQKQRIFALAAGLLAAGGGLHAQFNFDVDGRQVQVHSFLEQGFGYSNDNNFLTMNTSQGSFAMTDAGVNVSTNITDRFRAGAQVYVSNVGQLGAWHPELDWAYADYRFKDWFGIRGGKVKTALGLYNDTQDMSFLYTWALLPQSIYPTDLRDVTIAHTGADIYGHFGIGRAGSLAYTAYAGYSADSKNSGYYFNTADEGIPINRQTRNMIGTDVRWTTPVEGLTVGSSFMHQRLEADGTIDGTGGVPFRIDTRPAQRIYAEYADYTHGRLHVSTEYRRHYFEIYFADPIPGSSGPDNLSDQGFFISAAWRLTKRVELGAYNSRYYVDSPSEPGAQFNHIYDQAVTARIDLTKFWNVKIEEHFMNGTGDLYSAHGFYLRSNPNGLAPNTDLLVIRTGLAF
jgi:hypothetical protein